MQDVVPTLETTHSGIKEVLDSLVKSYQEKEKEFDAWRKEAGVQVSISMSVYCLYKSNTKDWENADESCRCLDEITSDL